MGVRQDLSSATGDRTCAPCSRVLTTGRPGNYQEGVFQREKKTQKVKGMEGKGERGREGKEEEKTRQKVQGGRGKENNSEKGRNVRDLHGALIQADLRIT